MLRRLFTYRTRTSGSSSPQRYKQVNYRPHIEVLEARWVPDGISWTGEVSTLWSVAENWSPQQVPGPNDDVSIGGAMRPSDVDQEYTIRSLSVTGNVLTVQPIPCGLTCPGKLIVTNGVGQVAGTVTANGRIVVTGNYDLSGGLLNIIHSVSVDGDFIQGAAVTHLVAGELAATGFIRNGGTIWMDGEVGSTIGAASGVINRGTGLIRGAGTVAGNLLVEFSIYGSTGLSLEGNVGMIVTGNLILGDGSEARLHGHRLRVQGISYLDNAVIRFGGGRTEGGLMRVVEAILYGDGEVLNGELRNEGSLWIRGEQGAGLITAEQAYTQQGTNVFFRVLGPALST